MPPMKFVALLAAASLVPATVRTDAPAPAAAEAQMVKVTVLSTMLAGDPGRGIGEWGFAALLEVDGRKLLIDTGARPGTVLQNARELGVDLSTVEEVVLTHNHGDHVNGLVSLRRELQGRNPRALAVAHVVPAIFLSRKGRDGRELNGLLPHRADFEALGGRFVEHDGAVELSP
ncbi:MAG: MBL fold metallo-hydrolase [Gemmatimonadota bacterium]